MKKRTDFIMIIASLFLVLSSASVFVAVRSHPGLFNEQTTPEMLYPCMFRLLLWIIIPIAYLSLSLKRTSLSAKLLINATVLAMLIPYTFIGICERVKGYLIISENSGRALPKGTSYLLWLIFLCVAAALITLGLVFSIIYRVRETENDNKNKGVSVFKKIEIAMVMLASAINFSGLLYYCCAAIIYDTSIINQLSAVSRCFRAGETLLFFGNVILFVVFLMHITTKACFCFVRFINKKTSIYT